MSFNEWYLQQEYSPDIDVEPLRQLWFTLEEEGVDGDLIEQVFVTMFEIAAGEPISFNPCRGS